jgi:hypothetical protein
MKALFRLYEGSMKALRRFYFKGGGAAGWSADTVGEARAVDVERARKVAGPGASLIEPE